MFMIMKRFRGDFGAPLVSLLPCPFFVDLGVGSPWGSPLTLSCLCWGGHLIPCLFSWQGVCVDHLKRCKTCNTSWAGPLPIPFTIPLVWYCCVTKLGRTLTQFVNHSSGLVLLLNQKMGRTLTHFVNHSSGLVYLKNRGGLEGHHVARANEALCDEPGKRTRRVVLGVIVDQLANPLNVLQPFLWSG